MGKDKKTPVTINGVEHEFENLTSEQQTYFNHIVDLDRKINNAKFNLDQLQVGRTAFHNALTKSLEET